MYKYKYDDPRKAYQEALAQIKESTRNKTAKLDLSELGLTELPPETGQLVNLQILDLLGNKLTIVPPEIMKLKNLIMLDLSWNKITEIPLEITRLDLQLLWQDFPPPLIGINLFKNPIETPPVEIVKCGHEMIVRYLKSHRKT